MKALFSLPPDERFGTARRAQGENVEVEVDRLRNGNVRIVEGELVSVAQMLPSDALVVRPDAGPDLAFPLAQVRAIRPRKWDR